MIQAGTPASPMCMLNVVAKTPLRRINNAESARSDDTDDNVWDMDIANLNIQACDHESTIAPTGPFRHFQKVRKMRKIIGLALDFGR